MDKHEIRYQFEQVLLPHWFFEKKAQLIGMLLQDEGLLYRVVGDLFQRRGLENPYSESQFGIGMARVADDVGLLKVSLPEPEESLECHCCYLVFDQTFGKLGFYNVEKSRMGGPFLCSRDTDENHVNYGVCTLDDAENMRRCAEIYMERVYRKP